MAEANQILPELADSWLRAMQIEVVIMDHMVQVLCPHSIGSEMRVVKTWGSVKNEKS